jgi:hypothetical protein
MSDGTEQCDADIERRVDEELDVFRDTLVRVVSLVPSEPHAVMRAFREPTLEIGLREPPSPADLQPLLQIELIDRGDDEEHGEDGEHAELVEEHVPVLVLERRVKRVVPGVEADVQPHLEELQADDDEQEPAAPPAVIAAEIGEGDAGKLFGCGAKLLHVGRTPSKSPSHSRRGESEQTIGPKPGAWEITIA